MQINYLPLWALAGSAVAYQATTTHYYDGQEGACGCGSSSGLDSWQLGIATNVYTAAGSQALFDTDDSTWCGAGCGKCYNLTSTGESPCSTCGTGGVTGDSIIVMVTNLCPYDGNEQWCPQVDGTNEYGYSYHFDIMAESEVFGNNVVVDFEPVACPGQATTDWETCVCYGETDTDETPAGMTSASAAGTSATSSASSSSSTSAAEVSTSQAASTTSVEASSASSTTSVAPESEVATSTPSVPVSTAVAQQTSVVVESSSASTLVASKTSGAVSSTTPAAGAVQSLYGQCGGINWTGPTTCVSGAVCHDYNPFYYQCISSSS